MMPEAAGLDLGSGWISCYGEDRARALLELPENWQPVCGKHSEETRTETGLPQGCFAARLGANRNSIIFGRSRITDSRAAAMRR